MSHPHHDLFENRKQFQLERLILFSDAVFAIAITLLVIEIKLPEINLIEGTSFEKSLIIALKEKHSELSGFMLSFIVIGQFWSSHHRMFGYVENFDTGLIWRNLLMLFWIVLVPFSSALNAKYGGDDFVWELYSFNMFMIDISMFFIWRYIGNPKRNLSQLAFDPRLRKMSITRSLSIAFIFLSGLLLCLPGIFILSWIARFIYLLIFPAMWIISKRYAIKNPAV